LPRGDNTIRVRVRGGRCRPRRYCRWPPQATSLPSPPPPRVSPWLQDDPRAAAPRQRDDPRDAERQRGPRPRAHDPLLPAAVRPLDVAGDASPNHSARFPAATRRLTGRSQRHNSNDLVRCTYFKSKDLFVKMKITISIVYKGYRNQVIQSLCNLIRWVPGHGKSSFRIHGLRTLFAQSVK
jgi:hypothetical protein